MTDIDPDKLRDLPGWEKIAPIPLCMGGDYRALTFCCKPGYFLTFAFKCRRDKKLSELGVSPEEFIILRMNSLNKTNGILNLYVLDHYLIAV